MDIRRWLVVQKITLMRGYGWANTPMIGVIFVSAVKIAFPGLVDSTWKFMAWSFLGLIGMYIIGYIDRKLRLFHEENDYIIESNPHMMEVVEATREEENEDSKKES